MLPIQLLGILPDSTVIELTDKVTDANWTTNAIGGFGSASLTMLGHPRVWLRDLPKLSMVRISSDTRTLFEGQVEDHEISLSDGGMGTTIQCFGLARLLSESSVRQIWMKRDMNFVETNVGETGPIFNNTGGGVPPASPGKTANLPLQTGRYDAADQTKNGVQITGNGVAVGANFGNCVQWSIPSGITLKCVIADVVYTGASFGTANIGVVCDVDNAPSGVVAGPFSAGTNQEFTLNSITNVFHIGVLNNGGATTPTAAMKAEIKNIRLLGVDSNSTDPGHLRHQATGYYGGTILTDLIALVPGLRAGVVETGSDFTIEAVERVVRSACQDVVDEIAAYYPKEWGVWEGGRFDWKTPNLDDPGWLLSLEQLSSLNLRSSVEGLSVTDYVLFSDAASGVEAESSATSTSRNNPYVKINRAKHVMTSPGFPMTTNTSAQLASRLNTNHGQFSFASGTCSLPMSTVIGRAVGVSGGVAINIRAGDNVKIFGLPKEDPFLLGRDGQTLFHVVSTSCDLNGEITLTLDSQDHAMDSLLARLAAVTRAITG